MNVVTKSLWKLLLSFLAVSFSLMFVVTLLLVYLVTIPFMFWYLVNDAIVNIWRD